MNRLSERLITKATSLVACRYMANQSLIDAYPVEHLYIYFATTREEAIFMAKAEIDEFAVGSSSCDYS